MADTSLPAPNLADATASAEIAPSSLRGYSAWQRAVNVTLPYQLKRAATLVREANAILSGKGG